MLQYWAGELLAVKWSLKKSLFCFNQELNPRVT